MPEGLLFGDLPSCSQAPAWEHNGAEAPASIPMKPFPSQRFGTRGKSGSQTALRLMPCRSRLAGDPDRGEGAAPTVGHPWEARPRADGAGWRWFLAARGPLLRMVCIAATGIKYHGARLA
jgi:hypothetical protein